MPETLCGCGLVEDSSDSLEQFAHANRLGLKAVENPVSERRQDPRGWPGRFIVRSSFPTAATEERYLLDM